MKPPRQETDRFDDLVGKVLASVTFVWNYFQLLIGTTTLNLYTRPRIREGQMIIRFGDAGYRDALCERIGKKVAATITTDEGLSLRFGDGAEFYISFRPEDRIYEGPESVVITDMHGGTSEIGDH